jgi:LacI family transcriptional regulator
LGAPGQSIEGPPKVTALRRPWRQAKAAIFRLGSINSVLCRDQGLDNPPDQAQDPPQPVAQPVATNAAQEDDVTTGSPTTIYKVAKAASVSASTVSRVLAGLSGVSPDTKARVLDVAKRLGYRPNSLARDLSRQASNTLAVLLPDISNPFFSSLVKEIQSLAEQAGFAVLLCSTRDDERIEQRNLDVLLSNQIRHVLVMGLRADSEEVQTYEDAGLRFIALDRSVPSTHAVRIHSDNLAGARAVTEHLIELGHRRIAHIRGPEFCDVALERYEGYRAALKAHRIRYDRRLVVTSTFDESGGRTALDTLVQRKSPFTAIFASNDLIAIGVQCAARDRGLRVPQDLSLAGFDDVPVASYTTPRITTVRQDVAAIAAAAMDAVRSGAATGPREVCIPVALRVRESTASPPV